MLNEYLLYMYVCMNFSNKILFKEGTRKLQITKNDIYMFKWMQYWTEPLDSKNSWQNSYIVVLTK